MDAIEEGTGGAVVPGGCWTGRELFLQFGQNALLGQILSSHFGPLGGIEGVIVVAVPIDVIGVQLFRSFIVLNLEEPASG